MFDIHTHILPNIDDGSSSLERSIEMVEDAIKQGITDLILTPHFDTYFNKCKFNVDYQREFNAFKEEILKRNLPINLYLGNEIYYTKGVMKYLINKKIFPLANTNKVLLEFSFTDERIKINDIIEEFQKEGYQIIIAHAERYYYSNYKLIKNWRENGALIQVNASSFYEKKTKKLAIKLLKENLIDYIASDVHSFRPNYIQKFIEDYQEIKYFSFE